VTDTNTSMPPPPSGGGNLRLVLIALLFLGAGGGLLFWALSGSGGEPKTAADMIPDAGPPEKKKKPTSDLFLPDDIPDAGPEEPEEPDAGAPAPRRRASGRGAWDCTADIDKAAAARVIAQNRAQVRSCYERALKQNNYLSGTLNVQVRIGSDGRVDATRFGGSLTDREVRSCVSRLTRSWRFPKPGGRCAVVAVPFNLTPRP